MYLLFALIVALIGLWISSGYRISDIPFSQLTLRMVLGSLLAIGAYVYALFLVIKSLEHDRIWPWRWTWPYFGNLVIRSILIAFIVWAGFWVIDKKQLDGFWFIAAVICIFIGVLYGMFSSEVEHFSEKKMNNETSESA